MPKIKYNVTLFAEEEKFLYSITHVGNGYSARTIFPLYGMIKETAVRRMGRPRKYIVNLTEEEVKFLKSTLRKMQINLG